MRVLLVSEYFPPVVQGGGELGAAELARQLAKSGHEVGVLTSYFSGLKKLERKEGATIYRRLRTGRNPSRLLDNVKRVLFFSRSLTRELRKLSKKYDVVHFLNSSFPQFKLDKPTFGTLNSYAAFCPKGNLFYKEKSVCSGSRLGKCVKCIMSSRYVGKTKLPWYLRGNPKFALALYLSYLPRRNALNNIGHFFPISGFVDKVLHKYRKNAHSTTVANLYSFDAIKNKKSKGFQFIFLGSLIPSKGVDLLLKAYGKVSGDSQLLIVGDGPERERLEKIADKRVRFLGKLSNTQALEHVAQSDVVVLPSRWPEPLPRSLVEALYLGKPVLTTNVGGNPECVKGNGFAIPPRVSALKEKLEFFMSHKLTSYGKASKKLFNKKFSSNVVIKGITKAYAEKVKPK